MTTQTPGLATKANKRLQLAGLALLLTVLTHPQVWTSARSPMLFAPLAIGLALTAWLGYGIVPIIGGMLALVQICFRNEDSTIWQAAVAALLTSVQMAAAWWCYRRAGGSRQIDDPRSATVFLLLVPGVFATAFAALEALTRVGLRPWEEFNSLAVNIWMEQALAIVALTPPLLAVATPWLVYYRLASVDPNEPRFVVHPRLTWTSGDLVETASLALVAGVAGGMLAHLHVSSPSTHWHWWGILLLLIVWASLRLGLRGGTLVAGLATLVTLVVAALRSDNPAVVNPLRANLLAQCCTALLIGASADWIRASESRYRQVIGQIPVLLYSGRFLRMPSPGKRAEVEILFVSPAARQVLGCEPGALVGDIAAWMQRVDPADRELLWAALAQLMLQNQPVTCEYRLADNEKRPARPEESARVSPASNPMLDLAANLALMSQRYVRDTLIPHYGRDGKLDGWEGVVEDITERRQLAQDLRRTTNMLQALVAHLPTGIYFVHGAKGLPLLVNSRARKLLGQRENLAGDLSHLSEIYRLHRTDGTLYPWQELAVTKALREGTTCMRDDIVVHRPDGRRIPLVTWAAPVDLGGQGQTDAAVWVLEDLTSLRQAEKARLQSEQELQKVQRLELVGRIASGVVHDFNNILTVIAGYAELARDGLDQHPARADLEKILRATEQAKRLAGQLLAFSKQRQVLMRPIDLSAVAGHALELVEPTLPTNIEIVRRGGEEVTVLADEPPLQQVILNLCLNAKDAMPEGGQLVVETVREFLQPGDAAVAGTRAAAEGGRHWARLTIADTGLGMNDAIKSQIFEPLFTTKERGTGLGLAVVKQIVEGFGGCIRVSSEPGMGARFDVWLPLRIAD
jgi:signal transduction histidine kinase